MTLVPFLYGFIRLLYLVEIFKRLLDSRITCLFFQQVLYFPESKGFTGFFVVIGDSFHTFVLPSIQQVVPFTFFQFDGEIRHRAATDFVAVVVSLVFDDLLYGFYRQVSREDVGVVKEFDAAAKRFVQVFVVFWLCYQESPSSPMYSRNSIPSVFSSCSSARPNSL
ncbi:hypothetical protein [Haloarcula vallismortis]|uniref:hypothetical protein n=1 Tax=Haloarcula vallismortis TaxID=28442 RepID=UPI00111391A6|nr:hypothetical protein [Haloarcula vallismortis]